MNLQSFGKFVVEETQRILGKHRHARFALLASSNKIEKSISFGPTSEEILRHVKQLKPTLVEGDHRTGLFTVEKFFTDSDEVKKKIYIFSDLQRQDWSPSRLPSLNVNADVITVKPPSSNSPNLAIRQISTELYVKDNVRRLRATVEVHNYSIKPAHARLDLTVGHSVESKSIDLRGDYSEKFVIDMENPSSNTALAEIVTDEVFVKDNKYFFGLGHKLR